MFLSLMYLPLVCLRHWRGLVVFVLLLPGAARRSTRIADTHHHAGQQTHAFTTALKESAESWEALTPLSLGKRSFRASGPRSPGPLPHASRVPPLPPVAPRRATAALSAASGPNEDQDLSTKNLKPNSWQARLDKALLDLDLKPETRIRLLQRAFEDPKLVEDVQEALKTLQEKGFGKGHPEVIETLWPTGTQARSDLEALQKLRVQVPELLNAARSSKLPSPGSAPPLPTFEDVQVVAEALRAVVTSTEKQKEIQKEIKDALKGGVPVSLETPSYTVVRSLLDGVELRKYTPFTVARRSMTRDGLSDSLFNSENGGEGFNALASYLFGKNADGTEMAMTTPVEISVGAVEEGVDGSSMAFVLPKENSATPPAPLSDDVRIEDMPERLVAVKAFPGIVTDEEIERQRTLVAGALAADGHVAAVSESAFSVLQYNSPLTVPWRRLNELAIVVVEKEAPEDSGAGVVEHGGEEAREDSVEEASEDSGKEATDYSNKEVLQDSGDDTREDRGEHTPEGNGEGESEDSGEDPPRESGEEAPPDTETMKAEE